MKPSARRTSLSATDNKQGKANKVLCKIYAEKTHLTHFVKTQPKPSGGLIGD